MPQKNIYPQYIKNSSQKKIPFLIRYLPVVLCSIFFVLCSLFVLGCESVREYAGPPDTYSGQVSIFLKGPDETSMDVSFDLQAVNIIAEDGTSREIVSAPLKISSSALTGRQIRLGENTLPANRYKRLQLNVKEAVIKREDWSANLSLPEEGIFVPVDFILSRDQNVSIFLNWDVDASVVDQYLFKPVFNVKSQVPELSTMLIYVSNEDSNNVSVINRQSGDVVATVMVGRKPRGIAASPGKARPRVYVANAGSNSISVIEPTTNKVEQEIPIRFGTVPESIAIAQISTGREMIFVANYGSDSVSVIDGNTYQEILKIDVGSGPIAIAADPPVEGIGSSRFLSFNDINDIRNYREGFFNVYVVNKNSKNVTIIEMSRSGLSIENIMTVNVEWNPMALSIDYQRAKVYVTNYSHEDLSVIDIIQVIHGNASGAVSTISNVGRSFIGVVPDPDLDRIYLLRDVTNELVIIRPFSEALRSTPNIAATLSPVIGTIRVGNSPRSLIFDPEGRNIYVVNRGSDTLSEIDKTTRRVTRTIPVGKKPYGITMFPF